MTVQTDLRSLADHFGILPGYFDFNGQERITTDETRKALLAANGVDVSSAAAIADALHRLRAEADRRWFPAEVIIEALAPQDLSFGLAAEWHVTRWGDSATVAEGRAGEFIALPPLQPDVYDMRVAVAGRVEHVRVLASPRRLPLLADVVANPRIWGMTAALYGLQSGRSTGLGDFEDLGALCRVAGRAGSGFLGINPVHNMGYADKQAISPYSPSHRGFYNSEYIALDSIPGLEQSFAAGRIRAAIASTFAPFRTTERIEYAARKRLHGKLLERLHAAFLDDAPDVARAAYAAWRDKRGTDLTRFARFEALSEISGPDWRQWPDDVESDRPAPTGREDFHCWLQWVADRELARAQATARDAGMALGLYLDLSVGPRRDGAESWCERGTVATGVSIGAPPDHLGPDGQNWNLAAYSPHKLQAAGYAPLRKALAQTMRHAGVIRIDHALGLNRSFWIPDDGSPGAYVRQPFEALLAVIKIEAVRSQTVVIGEDLGLVPDGFRDMMRAQGFYGYSVLQYEKKPNGRFRPPAHEPGQVLSSFGTHDTPTIRGFEMARDIDWRQRLGSLDDGAATLARAARRDEVEALKVLPPDGNADLVQAIHEMLAASGSEMICVQLDDILEQPEQQNLPGTIEQHPNWRRKYGIPVDELGADNGMVAVARLMNAHGRS